MTTAHPPATIGPYSVVRELGRGGMGLVYLAHDPKLDRHVAIKSLPAHLATDPERLSRFQREAKVLASLNHPGIAGIHGLEDVGGTRYLVLEYVDGETLATRLERGPIHVDEALTLARQIAEALEAAHEKGVVHRDLKPGNVMVSTEGKVKVLDFGLARTGDGAPSSSSLAASPHAPTVTTPPPVHSPTIAGAIMGTAGYMSPEQARGKAVDKRSDIFSFGCVLYEMLSGAQPFSGETVTDALGATLHKDVNLALLPQHVPPTVRLLLVRCLTKDRANRLHDIADARVELAQAISDPTGTALGFSGTGPHGARSSRRGPAPLVVALAAIALVGGTFPLWSARVGLPGGASATPRPVVRFTIEAPRGYKLPASPDGSAGMAISPAGDRIVFTAESEGKSCLFMREIASPQARLIPDTERCGAPFFSPDGKWLGYSGPSRLLKVPVEGGPALTVSENAAGPATWLDDGTIIYTAGSGGLWRVPASGGEPVQLAKAGQDVKTVDGTHFVLGFSAALAVPGADYVLATVWDADTIESYDLVSVSLKDGSVHALMRKAAEARLIARDRLVFARGATAMVVAFDPARGTTVGEPVVALDQVRTNRWADTSALATSLSGTMIYVPGGRVGVGRRLIRVDESGKATPLLDGTDAFASAPIVSPDGKRAVVATLRHRIELWVLDFERRSMSMLANVGENWSPMWSRDGNWVYMMQAVPGKPRVIVKRPAYGGEPEVVPGLGDDEFYPSASLADGSGLIFSRKTQGLTNNEDVVLYRFADAKLTPLRDGPGEQGGGKPSPDGSWLLYYSNESGRPEVYAGPLAAKGPNIQVSPNGGSGGRIARDGKRIFFINREDILMEATAEKTETGLRVSPPRKLFDMSTIGTTGAWSVYDILPQGGFVMVEPAAWEKESPVIHVVLNWADELRAKGLGK